MLVYADGLERVGMEIGVEQKIGLWGKQSAQSLLFLPFGPAAIRPGHNSDDGGHDDNDS